VRQIIKPVCLCPCVRLTLTLAFLDGFFYQNWHIRKAKVKTVRWGYTSHNSYPHFALKPPF